MKFNGWTLDSLIEYLKQVKLSPDLDYQCVTRAFGEIHLYNGEKKGEGESK